MKVDTRNGYEERISKCIKRLVQLVNDCDPLDLVRRQKYVDMFDTAKAVQEVILTNDNTVFVSNKLLSFELRMATLTGGEDIKEDTTAAIEEIETGSVERQVMEMMIAAQTSLQGAYDLIISANRLARGVAEISAIQTKAREIGPIMQAFSKLGGIDA